jgi:DNA polymerase-3 subunit gamma/tau
MSNEQFIVSARKYRPASWNEVVGQEAITDTLQRAVETEHLAQAYLFCGPRGVGKTTCARIFARQINFNPQDPENDYAFNIFELDAASHNSVDDIRQLIDQVRIPPQTGKYKVYIIDEVHMLSQGAFNAFLKTLEEPPRYAIFILATTEKHKILPTILSRCQIYDFHRISVPDIVEQLKKVAQNEGVDFEEEALFIIAEKADGAMRDGLSIFDQLVSFTNASITAEKVRQSLNVLDRDYYFRFVDLFLAADTNGALVLFHEVLSSGFEALHFMGGLGAHFRDLMMAHDQRSLNLLFVNASTIDRYREQAKKTGVFWLVKALSLIQDAETKYKQSRNPRLLTEVCLMQICTLAAADQKKNNAG